MDNRGQPIREIISEKAQIQLFWGGCLPIWDTILDNFLKFFIGFSQQSSGLLFGLADKLVVLAAGIFGHIVVDLIHNIIGFFLGNFFLASGGLSGFWASQICAAENLLSYLVLLEFIDLVKVSHVVFFADHNVCVGFSHAAIKPPP